MNQNNNQKDIQNNEEVTLESILRKLSPKEQEYLLSQIQRDVLTGLYNRTYYENNIESIINSAKGANPQGKKYDLGILMIDVDSFKYLNDNFGHQTGDKILNNLAKIIQSQTKSKDYALRWGGEEFLIILPEATAETGEQLTKRIKKKIAKYNSYNKEQKIGEDGQLLQYELRISTGYALWDNAGEEPFEEAINRADQLMYQEKRAKKNNNALKTDNHIYNKNHTDSD